MCKAGECLECMTIDRNQKSDYLEKIARFLIDSGNVKTDDMTQEEVFCYVVEVVNALTDAKARAKTAEENWHKNEARLGKLQMVTDALAEIVEYDTGDSSHDFLSQAKTALAEYEALKGAA